MNDEVYTLGFENAVIRRAALREQERPLCAECVRPFYGLCSWLSGDLRGKTAVFNGQEQAFDLEFIASASAVRRIPRQRVRQPPESATPDRR